MKKNIIFKMSTVAAIAVLSAVYLFTGNAGAKDSFIISEIPPIVDVDGHAVADGFASLEEVELGGVAQSILIRTQNISNPVLLVLHGGPGATLIPFIEYIQPTVLEKNFTVVHWDQRGAGKSYDPSLTLDDLSAENLISDTVELTNILRQRFEQDKIFLTGHSWGSALGFLVIQQDTTPYHAYIASGERISWVDSHQAGFEWVKHKANETQQTEILEQIAKVEPFDVTDSKDVAVLYQGLAHYRGGDVYTVGLWDEMMGYAMGGKSPYYTMGEINSYLDAMKVTQQAIEPFATSYDLRKTSTKWDIPIHFIQGEYDYNAPETLSRAYYDSLDVPAKSYTVIKNAGHTMMYDNPDAWAAALIDIKTETLGK